MSFGSIINTTLIGPLKLVFEVLFNFAYKLTGNVGVSIFLLSLAMNFLVLPLYRCADAMQERAKNKEMELHDGIAHIKKTFSGNERMMMLETYYKQNNYSPMSALSGSVSLLLEIPFFIAAYQFLSNAAHLQGATLGPIVDLADPDGLIKIGSFSINVLPFLMTIINMAASVLFLKGAPLKSKIQLYAMAIFFLVFLYTSPSGLVFYWTLNNVFSLFKTIFYKLKNPKKVLTFLGSITGALTFLLVMIFDLGGGNLKIASLILALALQIPVVLYFVKKKISFAKKEKIYQPNKKHFLLGAAFLTILLGLFIPSAFISANATEFVDLRQYLHPNWYLVSATCLSAGTFLVWFSVFYWLASPKGKVAFEKGMWIACVVMLVNYLFFGTKLGNISSSLRYDNGMWFSFMEYFLNVVVVVGVGVGMFFLITKFKKFTAGVLMIATFAIGGMSVVNFAKIGKDVKGVRASASEVEDETYSMQLTSTGKNVIVIMLDRAIGAYFPFMQREMQMRKEKGLDSEDSDFLSGFTYYSNVISFGNHTNFAAPALLGGYEYTPVEINKRDTISLAKKFNEANLLMPRIFTEQWTDCNAASIFDPVYTNNSWIADLDVYEDEYYNPNGNIVAQNTIGAFVDSNQRKTRVENRQRDFFCFSLMKTMPLPAQKTLYDDGQYNRVNTVKNKYAYSTQVAQNNKKANGIRAEFMENWNTLLRLPEMTKDSAGNKFVFFRNDVTHEEMLVDEKTYTPTWAVDNREYDKEYAARFDPYTFTAADGTEITYTINMDKLEQVQHYQTNLAALLQLENWFDYLKANGMYDNSRIIITGDHGYYLDQVDVLNAKGLNHKDKASIESFFPLLLVKDFGETCETGANPNETKFMTNADVPLLAAHGPYATSEKLIENPVNPFTGNSLAERRDALKKGEQFIIRSDGRDWNPVNNDGNCYNKAKWASVSDNLWDMSKWKAYNKKTVLKEHQAP